MPPARELIKDCRICRSFENCKKHYAGPNISPATAHCILFKADPPKYFAYCRENKKLFTYVTMCANCKTINIIVSEYNLVFEMCNVCSIMGAPSVRPNRVILCMIKGERFDIGLRKKCQACKYRFQCITTKPEPIYRIWFDDRDKEELVIE